MALAGEPRFVEVAFASIDNRLRRRRGGGITVSGHGGAPRLTRSPLIYQFARSERSTRRCRTISLLRDARPAVGRSADDAYEICSCQRELESWPCSDEDDVHLIHS